MSITAHSVPVSEAVATGIVRLGDERRYDIPVTVICPEFSVAQARQWIDDGVVPELDRAEHVDFLDLESGHWPMFTRPTELADMLSTTAHG